MSTLYTIEVNDFENSIKEIHNRVNYERKEAKDISSLYLMTLHVFNSEFLIESLSQEFIDDEINNKFLEDVIYDAGNKEENDEKNSEAILVLVREMILKLNFTDGLAYDLLKAWKEYEEIVFDIKQFYREHFIHQFRDFLFGCFFLQQLWQSSKTFYDKRRFLRRWLLASMYHDIGYPAESLGEMRENLHKRFFNKIPNYLINRIEMDTYDKNEENLNKLLKNIALIHLFSENISVSDLPLNKIEHYIIPHTEIYNLLFDEFRQTIDHGVTGAIFFLKTALIDLREVVIDPSSTHKTTISTEYEPYSHLIDDLFVSASAIAGHNLRTKIYPSYTVDFSTRPIASLLNFCDDFQEWDRRQKLAGNSQSWSYGPFQLSKIEVENRNLKLEAILQKGYKTKYIEKLCSSLQQLFETNLSDINDTFFEEISLTFYEYIDENNVKETNRLVIKLNIGKDRRKLYRIGRYNITHDLRDLLGEWNYKIENEPKEGKLIFAMIQEEINVKNLLEGELLEVKNLRFKKSIISFYSGNTGNMITFRLAHKDNEIVGDVFILGTKHSFKGTKLNNSSLPDICKPETSSA